jgi:hypothetical protein
MKSVLRKIAVLAIVWTALWSSPPSIAAGPDDTPCCDECWYLRGHCPYDPTTCDARYLECVGTCETLYGEDC